MPSIQHCSLGTVGELGTDKKLSFLYLQSRESLCTAGNRGRDANNEADFAAARERIAEHPGEFGVAEWDVSARLIDERRDAVTQS